MGCYFYISLSWVQGSDRFMAKVDIEVSEVSASAITAIEKNGGRVVSGIPYTRFDSRDLAVCGY